MSILVAVESVLNAMRESLLALNNGEEVLVEGVTGSLVGDEDIRADVELGRLAIQKLAENRGIACVECEGQAVYHTEQTEALYKAFVDPLDGSLYYKMRGAIKGFFPYAGVITIMRNVPNPTFDDIVAAGIMNYVSGDLFSAIRYDDGTAISYLNGVALRMPEDEHVDITKRPLIGEMYYPENREMIAKIFSGKKGYLRSVGCAAIEMAVVSSGQTSAFICDRQKGHELGAAYLLVTGAGGAVFDFSGDSLANKSYEFNKQYDVALTQRTLQQELLTAIQKQL